MIDEQFIVYKEWPEEVISEAISEFNHQMHEGAGIEEIRAGLHGLDFLTRRATLNPNLQARLDGALIEAEMRVELLGVLRTGQRNYDGQMKLVITSVRNLKRQAEAILQTARRGGDRYFAERYESFDEENE